MIGCVVLDKNEKKDEKKFFCEPPAGIELGTAGFVRNNQQAVHPLDHWGIPICM